MKLFIAIALAVVGTACASEITICHGVPENTFIPDVSHCANWFRCTSNGPVPGSCPSPWLFNPNTRECDWEHNFDCFRCSTTQPIQSTPVAGSCVLFIRCINGAASQHACQSGLRFNPATEQCDVPENVPCDEVFTCPPNIPPGQMIAFRSDTNCSEFRVCAGQAQPVLQSCNPVLHFDPVTQQCTFPNMTDCPIADDGGGTDPPGGTTTTTTTQAPFNCQADGRFPHPTTCASFIVCVSGTPHFFNCSDGLHFNDRTGQCDLPGNAQCALT